MSSEWSKEMKEVSRVMEEGRKLAFSTKNNYAVARFILNKYEAKELGCDFFKKHPPLQRLGSIREKRQQLERRIEECKELWNKRK